MTGRSPETTPNGSLFAESSPRPWFWWMSEEAPWEIGSEALNPEPHIGVSVTSGIADAELICKAVNEYEALLDLERVVRRIQVPDGRYRMIARRALKRLDESRGE